MSKIMRHIKEYLLSSFELILNIPKIHQGLELNLRQKNLFASIPVFGKQSHLTIEYHLNIQPNQIVMRMEATNGS
jgi:hypothetical protein